MSPPLELHASMSIKEIVLLIAGSVTKHYGLDMYHAADHSESSFEQQQQIRVIRT